MGPFPSLFLPKPNPAPPLQVADHPVPNRILRRFEFQGERERGSILFSKACKSLYRRRFKEIEDAPLAAYMFFATIRLKRCGI